MLRRALFSSAQRAAAAARPAPPVLAPLARSASALGARALSSTAVRTVKMPPSLQSILNDFQKSKTLSRTSKSAPERMVRAPAPAPQPRTDRLRAARRARPAARCTGPAAAHARGAGKK